MKPRCFHEEAANYNSLVRQKGDNGRALTFVRVNLRRNELVLTNASTEILNDFG